MQAFLAVAFISANLLSPTQPQAAPGQGAGTGLATPPSGGRPSAFASGGNNSRAVVDPRILQIMREGRKTIPTVFDTASAANVVAILLEDNKLDPADFDFLDELTQSRIRAISVESSANPSESELVGTQSGKVAAIFEAPLLKRTSDLIAAAVSGETWSELVSLAQYSPSSNVRFRKQMTAILNTEWEKSSVSNAYGPFADKVSAWFKLNEQLPKERQTPGRWLMVGAAKQLDNARNDSIPDFLYDWLRPKSTP